MFVVSALCAYYKHNGCTSCVSPDGYESDLLANKNIRNDATGSLTTNAVHIVIQQRRIPIGTE
jgi:hypothetical protein